MKNKYLSILLLAMSFGIQGNAQCLEDTHTPFSGDSWLSCEAFTNPNPAHPASHWIMYDLGFEYILDSTHLWNYNVWGKRSLGAKEVAIDYSLDGVNWTSLDEFTLEQASGSYKYQGTAGPKFDHTQVRYVLLTALSNWGDEDCTGLSEVKFFVSEETVAVDPELETAKDFMEVSPNPVETMVNVSIKSEFLPERVALYDLSGRLIEERLNVLSKNVAFQMKGLAGGVYFVKAWVGETLLTEKVVKVK